MKKLQYKADLINVRDEEVRMEKENLLREYLNGNDDSLKFRLQKNQIITDLLMMENIKKQKEIVESLSRNKKDIVDIHIVSDDIALIEEYDKCEEINYLRPVINGKLINHCYDNFDKALIGAISYKYGVQDFAYNAMTAMCGIKDEE